VERKRGASTECSPNCAGHFHDGFTGVALVAEHRNEEALVESFAGYQILMTQTNPPPKWMQSARKDLVAEYEALNQPARAALMRAQIAMSTGDPKERDE
jgi:hypothetical protein